MEAWCLLYKPTKAKRASNDKGKSKAAAKPPDVSKMSKEERRRLREQLDEVSDDE